MDFANRVGIRDGKNRGVKEDSSLPPSIWRYGIPIFRHGEIQESSILGGGWSGKSRVQFWSCEI